LKSDRKKIVFINQAAGYLTIDIVNAFADKYDDIYLIAGGLRVQDIELNKKVKFTKILSHTRASNLKRILAWIWGSIQIFFLLLFKFRKFEIFYISIPPMAYLCSLFLPNRFSVLVFDIYPDVLKLFKIKESNLIYRAWERANRKLFPKAYRIYTLTEGMALQLSNYIPITQIHVVPLWTGLTNLKPVDKKENKFSIEHNLQDKFIVQYSGNISPAHGVELLVELARELANEKDILFLIIGRGQRQVHIKELIEKYKLTNCMMLPFQPDDIIKYSLASADLGVIILDEKTSLTSVPSKTYNLMAVGVPLLCIASPESELSRYIDIYKNGRRFDKNDFSAIKEFILELKKDNALLEEYKLNSLKASSEFTLENANKFFTIYQ